MNEMTKSVADIIMNMVRESGREMEANYEMGITISRGNGTVLIATKENDEGLKLTEDQFEWVKTALDK